MLAAAAAAAAVISPSAAAPSLYHPRSFVDCYNETLRSQMRVDEYLIGEIWLFFNRNNQFHF